jgi:hypothetical protein
MQGVYSIWAEQTVGIREGEAIFEYLLIKVGVANDELLDLSPAI